jgi:hypothetical protein
VKTEAFHIKQKIGYASCACELVRKCINAQMLGCLNVVSILFISKSGISELLEEIEAALCGVALCKRYCETSNSIKFEASTSERNLLL